VVDYSRNNCIQARADALVSFGLQDCASKMNAQCTRDAEVHLFMVALEKVQRVMAKLSSDYKFSGRYNTVTISGVVRKHVNDFDVLLTVHLRL